MTVYKFALVGVVVVIGETVEHHRPGWGRAVILFGCAAAAFAFRARSPHLAAARLRPYPAMRGDP